MAVKSQWTRSASALASSMPSMFAADTSLRDILRIGTALHAFAQIVGDMLCNRFIGQHAAIESCVPSRMMWKP